MRREIEMKDMGTAMGELLTNTGKFVSDSKIETNGQPLTIYHKYEPPFVDMEVGHPVKEKSEGKGEIQYTLIPKSKALKIVHYGDYADLHISYREVAEYMKNNSIEASGPAWERYISDPRNEPDKSKWQTDICHPIK